MNAFLHIFIIIVFTAYFIFIFNKLITRNNIQQIIKISQKGIISKNLIRVGNFETPYDPIYKIETSLRKNECCKPVVSSIEYNINIYKEDHVIYTCPKCKEQHELIFAHGDTIKCKCGLFSQTYGNGIRIWTQ